MLKKLVKLENIGLLRDGILMPATFDKVTLIYAENGRGKSTVANILRAIGALDAQSIIAGRTIDTENTPHINLLCEKDGAHSPVSLKDGSWTGTPPNILVFDPTFVEDNVYSGQEVRPEQRQALLQFVLGEESVKLEKEISDLTKKISEETKKLTESSKQIAAYAKDMSVTQFVALADVTDADAQITSLKSRMEAAKNAAAFSQRALPYQITAIAFDVDAFYKILHSSFDGIQNDAKTRVQEHFDQHTKIAGIENWVKTGREFGVIDGCPFCGQTTENSTLIEAYEAYFNKAYNDFIETVAKLAHGIEIRLPEAKIDAYQADLNINSARINAWKDQLSIVAPSFDIDLAKKTLTDIRSLTKSLNLQKQNRPLETTGTTDEKNVITKLLENIQKQIENYNKDIELISKKIQEFNLALASETPNQIASSITRLEAVIAKRSLQACSAVADYSSAEALKKELGEKKTIAKAALDKNLPVILKRYQEHINRYLKSFGAEFSIEELTSASQGGLMRSEYELKLRGKHVPLGKRNDNSPNFRTALSEGDKRTLALSFFFARLSTDVETLKDKVVVLDDPVCSMDTNRRKKTMTEIAKIASKGAQIVVLSHDAYFLNDLRTLLRRATYNISTNTHEIKRSENNYSSFSSCDLEVICQSQYEREYNDIRSYITGNYAGENYDIAKKLRLVVEGYFHRRFPSPALSKAATLGGIISEIRDSPSNSPLHFAKPCLSKLDELNEFSNSFHHEDNQIDIQINDAELRQYSNVALQIIYGDY